MIYWLGIVKGSTLGGKVPRLGVSGGNSALEVLEWGVVTLLLTVGFWALFQVIGPQVNRFFEHLEGLLGILGR